MPIPVTSKPVQIIWLIVPMPIGRDVTPVKAWGSFLIHLRRLLLPGSRAIKPATTRAQRMKKPTSATEYQLMTSAFIPYYYSFGEKMDGDGFKESIPEQAQADICSGGGFDFHAFPF